MKKIAFPSLAAEMARYGIGPKDIAKTLGCTDQTARRKLNGQYPFTNKEMAKIRDVHFPGLSIDYLFYENTAYRKEVS